MMITTSEPTAVVIDIGDTVDVVLIPGGLAARLSETVPAAVLARAQRLVALLIARLGAEAAVPVIDAWITHTPSVLSSFPDEVFEDLVSGRIGAIRG